MDKPKHSPLYLVVQVLLCLLAFGLLGLAVWQNRDAIQDVFARPLDWPRLAVAFAVYVAALLLTFLRWYVLVRAQGLPFRVRDAMRLGFIGNVFNLVIPGAVGGDLIKAAFLYREQARKAQAIGSMLIDRAVGLIGLFLLATIMGAVLWPSADAQVRRLTLVAAAGALGGALGLAALFTPALVRLVHRLFARRQHLDSLFAELVDMAAAYRGRLPVVFLALAMAVSIHALFVLAFFLVSQALFPAGLPSLREHYLIVPLVLFTTAVPLPFGALGVSEQVSDQLFLLVRHPGGAVAMMGYRVLMYAGGALSVCVYLANLRQVRTLTAQADAEEAGSPAQGSSRGAGLDTA